MRTVRGRTDHVVVVGAGFAGLSAALHLAGRGREVTVVERATWPGGRAGRRDIDGYRIDTGPTVLTMPDIIDEVFAAVGESRFPANGFATASIRRTGQCSPTAPPSTSTATPTRWPPRCRNSPARNKQPATARCVTGCTGCTAPSSSGFIAANFDSPLSMLNPQLARLAAIGGFRRWDTMVKRYISDPRLRRVFTFQSLYAGVAPQDALAVYAVIAYMDTVSGVFFPRGGVRALPDALAAAAARRRSAVLLRIHGHRAGPHRRPDHRGDHRPGSAHRLATRWC